MFMFSSLVRGVNRTGLLFPSISNKTSNIRAAEKGWNVQKSSFEEIMHIFSGGLYVKLPN